MFYKTCGYCSKIAFFTGSLPGTAKNIFNFPLDFSELCLYIMWAFKLEQKLQPLKFCGFMEKRRFVVPGQIATLLIKQLIKIRV